MSSSRTAYFYLGAAGVVAGWGVALVLGLLGGVDWTSLVVCMATPLASFFVGIKIRHIIEGAERLVLLEGFAAALGGTGLALWIAGRPVAAGLDLVTIGVGVFLVLGRLGCLSVGCCHGRPHEWGVRYDDRHVRLGFPTYYVGVPLLPIQAFASAAQLGLAAGCALLYLTPHPPGSVLGFYFALYAPARFAAELVRGDPHRRYALGLSYAQWLCLGIAWVVFAFAPGLAPLQLGSAIAVSLMSATVVAYRRRMSLTSAAHIRDVAAALARLERSDDPVPVATTERGLRISRTAGHIALSLETGDLDVRAAETLAGYIAILGHLEEPTMSAGESPGVYHLRFTGT